MLQSFDDLKNEIDAILRAMVEAKKKETVNALKEVKCLCKELGLIAGMFNLSLAKDIENE